MLRVKDMYVSTKDIKSIRYITSYSDKYLIIKYAFDDEEVKIDVDDFEEYVGLADMICEKINTSVGI